MDWLEALESVFGADGARVGRAIQAAILFGLSVRIVAKAGYATWWASVLLIPGLNIIMAWVFIYAYWPALRRAAEPLAPHHAGPAMTMNDEI
ncbi:MAG: hypothetical protein EXQ91_05220 [Alphaproteobacteria bacterium]|nr:hypothetical protein [Alphaproteobacteria bacterium]